MTPPLPPALSLITPPLLHPSSKIALLSPSSRLNTLFPLRIHRGISALESLGFEVLEIFTPDLPTTPVSSNIKRRVEEVHRAFADPSIHAIICTIGGISSNELLPHLDYDLIRSNPKPFIGYSDMTLLHSALYTNAGLKTFYGPALIPSFGEYPCPLHFTVDSFLNALQSAKPIGLVPRSDAWTEEFLDWTKESDPSHLRVRVLKPNSGWRWLRQGKAKGVLLGGCLPSVCQLQGTPYAPSYQDAILLLELPEGEAGPDRPIPIDVARSNVADLANGGVFREIVGLVIGRPYAHTEAMTQVWESCVLGICEMTERDFPVLVGVDVGHTDPMLTVPLGAECVLDAERDVWEIVEAGVV